MGKIWIPIAVATGLIISGCQKKKEDDFVSDSLKEVVVPQNNNAASGSAKSTATTQPTHQNIAPVNGPKVPPIGIKVSKDQIVIDTKQTKKFLEELSKKIDNSFKKAAQDLQQNKNGSPNETGIVITQDRIEVDLNKTQKYMEKWINSMEQLGKQLDSIANEIEKSMK